MDQRRSFSSLSDTARRPGLTDLEVVQETCKAPRRLSTQLSTGKLQPDFRPLLRFARPGFPGPRIQFNFENSETFMQLVTLIHWTEHFCCGAQGRLEIATRARLVTPGKEIRDPRGGKSGWTSFRIFTLIDRRA